MHWYFQAAGMFKTFKAIRAEKSEVKDAYILDDLYSAYWKLLDVVTEDLELMDPSKEFMGSEQRRSMLIGIIIQCLEDPNRARYALHC